MGLENQKLLYPGEGLTKEQIYALGCQAHFEGRVDEGMTLFNQLKPSDEDVFIRAHCFLSQVLSFSRNYDLALNRVLWLLRIFPNHEKVLHYAVLVHSYREEYERAGQLLDAYEPAVWDRGGYYYQAACIFAGLQEYVPSLLALSMSLEEGGILYHRKLWYDPELRLLWKALPAMTAVPKVRKILMKAYWPALLATFDPEAPFDELDPGNLRSFSAEEMHFVGVVPQGPLAFIIEERRSDNPTIYDALQSRLKDQREQSVQGLKNAISRIS